LRWTDCLRRGWKTYAF